MGVRNVVFVTMRKRYTICFDLCPFATLVWRTVHVAFNLRPPTSMANMFGNSLGGVHPKLKAHIRVVVCALVWAIWNCRNDLVFNGSKFPKKIAGHLQSCQFNPYLVYPASCGGPAVHRLWVQPLGDGCTGFIQPGWMAIQQ